MKGKKTRASVRSGTILVGLILCNWCSTEKLFVEIMAKIFPNLMKNINKWIQATLKTGNMKRTTSSPIIVILFKTSEKETILKTAKVKDHIKCKEQRKAVVFPETKPVRRQRGNILKVLKDENSTLSLYQ